ncbi:MAG: THUMP domain-containing protein [Desulfuromonadales bacterium]
MDHRRTETIYLVVSPGLETACAEELSERGHTPTFIGKGGVAFTGRLQDLYQVNLWSRTASRVLIRLGTLRSRAFPDLYKKAVRLPWGRFIKPETAIVLRASSHQSRLGQTDRIAETLEAAINRSLGRSTNPSGNAPQLVLARIVNDEVTLSIDSSGERLHRRGYRQTATRAPLRETLAAGILRLLGWDGRAPLVDPMCGSGTFVIEAALLAAQRAPGLQRTFAFMAWPGYRPGLWTRLCDEARRQQKTSLPRIQGIDASPRAIAAARQNSLRSGCAENIQLFQQRLEDVPPEGPGAGWVVCNPPYGHRLPLGSRPEDFYQNLGDQLKRIYPGWRLALVCPDDRLARATGLPLTPIATLNNGGLTIQLFATPP